MASLHIRAGRGLSDMRAPLSPILEIESDVAAAAAKSWEDLSNEVWSPIRTSRPQRRTINFGRRDLHQRFPTKIDERAEHEFMPVPFPRTEIDVIDLVEEDAAPKPIPGLRKRSRITTMAALDFEAEEEEGEAEPEVEAEGGWTAPTEEAYNCEDAFDDIPEIPDIITLDDLVEPEELDIELPNIPLDYSENLLEEELPPEAPELDFLEDDEFEHDADYAPSKTWEFMRPSSPRHEEPFTPPALSRPIGLASPVIRTSARSPSPLLLPPTSTPSSSSQSSSPIPSPLTSPPSSPPSRPSRLPQPTFPRKRKVKETSSPRMSWSSLPPNLFDSFLGAEKEYRRLLSLVESPSLFEEEMYDSDATVRASDHGAPHSRSSRREWVESRLR